MPQLGLLAQLIQAFRALPGVGPKSAQRMAFHLLQRNRQGAQTLAEALLAAVKHIGHCQECRTLTEGELCAVCANPDRDRTQLCVVETPAEVFAIEQSTGFKGRFFVLNGRLSPLGRHRPRRIAAGFIGATLANRHGQRIDPRHQYHGRGGSDRSLHQRNG